MTESEKILEFIDGSLDSDVEQRLFSDMAHRPELRTALRQFIAIGEGVRADREAFSPPAHLEHALMTGLGLAPFIGPMAPAVTSGAGWLAKLAVLGTKFWPLAAAFTVGAIVAGGSTYLASKSSSDTVVQVAQPAPTITQESKPQANIVVAPPSQTVPLPPSSSTQLAEQQPVTQMASSEKTREYVRTSTPRFISHRTLSQTTTRDNNSTSTTTTLGSNAISTTATPPVNLIDRTPLQVVPQSKGMVKSITNGADTALHQLMVPPAPLTAPTQLPETKPTETIAALSFEGRYQFYEPQIAANNARQVSSSWENFAGGVYISLSKSVKIGGEIGKERYAQTLAVFHGDTMFVEQMPSYFWGGIAARYTFDALPVLGGLRPFAQLTGAVSNAGPLARGRVGFDIPIIGDLSASGAFEVSSLFYSYKGQSLAAGSMGGTIGIEYAFGLW